MSALHPDLAPPVALVRPTFTYERRRPELTDLHAAIRIGWPQLREAVQEETGTKLPKFVLKGFAGYLACGQLPRGFARFRCGDCRKDILVAQCWLAPRAYRRVPPVVRRDCHSSWSLDCVAGWRCAPRSDVCFTFHMRAITKHYQRDAELQKRGEVRDSDLPGINSRPR